MSHRCWRAWPCLLLSPGCVASARPSWRQGHQPKRIATLHAHPRSCCLCCDEPVPLALSSFGGVGQKGCSRRRASLLSHAGALHRVAHQQGPSCWGGGERPVLRLPEPGSRARRRGPVVCRAADGVSGLMGCGGDQQSASLCNVWFPQPDRPPERGTTDSCRGNRGTPSGHRPTASETVQDCAWLSSAVRTASMFPDGGSADHNLAAE